MQYLLLLVLSAFAHLAFAAFDEEIHRKFKELSEDDFIEYFNTLNSTWKVQKYDVQDMVHRVCKYLGEAEHLPALIVIGKEESLPLNFDARKKWVNCPSIGKVYDQGRCASCWTFGVATTLSDRICIHSNQSVELSEQDFQCCEESYVSDICNRGYPSKAFDCWVKQGLVTQECKPYNIDKLKNHKCVESCDHGKYYITDKYFGRSVYRIADDPFNIKWELSTNGPIQAVFTVYEDFLHYSSGIYEHRFGEIAGWLSVRIIGYGEENGVPYWLAANSWGKGWGEEGFFRIERYQSDLYFESQLLSGYPRL